MRINIDYELCEANGVCVGMVPDVFDLDDADNLILLIGDISPERRQELSEVAGSCPRSALSLTDG